MTEDKDPIDRVREIRHKISAEFGHDTKRLTEHYRELEKRYADRMLYPEKRPSQPKVVK